MATKHIVNGMTCGGCAGSVARAIEAAAPGARVSVDLSTKTVTVEGADDATVAKAVEGAGYEYVGPAG